MAREVQPKYTDFENSAACWADAQERMTKGRSMPWCVVSVRAAPGWPDIHPDAIAPCDECGATFDQARMAAQEAGAFTCMNQWPPDRWLCWQCCWQRSRIQLVKPDADE